MRVETAARVPAIDPAVPPIVGPAVPPAVEPWEMPGLDALEARARGERPGPGHAAHRRAEAIGTGVVALLLLALVPSQIGALPPPDPSRPAPSSTSATSDVAGAPYTAGTEAPVEVAGPASSAQPTAIPAPQLAVVDVAAAPYESASASPTATVKPTPGPTPNRNQQPALVGGGSSPAPGPTPQPSGQPKTYKKDLYDAAAVRYQDPDMTACTAASTEVMLNLIARRGTPGSGFAWTATTSYDVQESILTWERAHDTLDAGAPGSDPHGWRNALNYYGWNAYTTPGARQYEDIAYGSYDDAVRAAVVALARQNRPVGLLGWAGGHAQIMTGYEVYGLDPAVSSDFTVQAVYLTDPLASNHLLDSRITYSALQSGSTIYRFTAYDWRDSAADDPYTPGTLTSWREWYGKWVIIAPVSSTSVVPAGR